MGSDQKPDPLSRGVTALARIYQEAAITHLTPHFALDEFTYSATARAHGLDNTPGNAVITALTNLCINILEPVRAHYRCPVKINSGYRSLKVNAAVGSKPTSQHVRGEAADFEVPGYANGEVALWIRKNLDFDQLILEAHRKGDPASGWVHCSWRPEKRRKSVLTMTLGSHGAIYTRGLNV